MTNSCPPKAEAADSNSAGCTTFSAVSGGLHQPHACRTAQEHARTKRDSAYNVRTAEPVNPILAYIEIDAGVAARFWSKVDRRGPDECWVWTASRDSRGYGRFKIASFEKRIAQRVAWSLHHHQEPGALVVRHICDNPPCCNPAHLLIGTPQDNADDKVERGRCRSGRQDGENNPRALITVEQVGEIVGLFRDGFNNQQIARRYPVGDALISRIRTGRSWRKQSASFGWEPQRLVGPPPPRSPVHIDRGEVA